MAYNEHRLCTAGCAKAKAENKLYSGCLRDPACTQATSQVRRSGHLHPCPSPCTQSAAASSQLKTTQGSGRDGAFHWLKGSFFLSVFLCSIFTLQISLDMVSLDLFYNTSILFCLYCVFPALICFTLSVLMLSSMHEIWETSLGSATFPSINQKDQEGGLSSGIYSKKLLRSRVLINYCNSEVTDSLFLTKRKTIAARAAIHNNPY